MATDFYDHCPKCGHVPPQPLTSTMACPACGVYVFKWQQARVRDRERANHASHPKVLRFARLLTEPLDSMSTVNFYGRCMAFIGLALWSWRLIGYDYRSGAMAASFMHTILLPIHEAGHVFFRLFGEFMTVAGGSFIQLALPLGIGVAFVVKNRDNFGAALGLWWASVSVLDLSPYIYDALHPSLVLLGGGTGEAGNHDWIYLFNALGQLHNAQFWGTAAHGLGSMGTVLALVWAAGVLWRQRGSLKT